MRVVLAAGLLLWVCAVAPAPGQTSQPSLPSGTNLATQWEAMFPRDAEGFTVFPSTPGAHLVLVSSSEGNDNNDGSAGSPVMTFKRAMSLVEAHFPNRILFKRGDVFPAPLMNDVIECCGRGPGAPMIIGAYGPVSQPRPVIEAMISLGMKIQPNYLVIQSLDFYASSRDPSIAGFDLSKEVARQDFGVYTYTSGKYLWIEDCRFRFQTIGLDMQGKDDHFHGLVVRRCEVLDSYDNGGHSQGIYVDSYDNVLIEENVFDHNGWNENVAGAGRTIFNHNMYLQHTSNGEDRQFIVRNNVVARAASHGCQLRPGGIMENNLFLRNALAGFVADTSSIVSRNVVLDGDGIGPDFPRGSGLEVINCPKVLVEGNIIAHKQDKINLMSAMSYNPISKDAPPAESRGEIRNNAIYDWTGTGFYTTAPSTGLNFHDNVLSLTDQALVELKDYPDGYRFQNNRYFASTAQPFRIGDTWMDLSAWCKRTGETADQTPVHFVDPNRTIATYAASIHLARATLEGFLAAARTQRRGHWDDRLTADAVNTYIRAGFAVKP
ncbi:MAG: right-handed parallel beta-helix repeat-containing protein [Planctomycetota bacterium]|nr:right-handed parallel beta-helix repeat-containing protein [Planctomycetota bacterium]